jgi:hypothetical protein
MGDKYYFFLDETGDHGLSFVDINFPLFLLCGCLFQEKELEKIEKQVNQIKIDIFGTVDVIFHSREIRKCEGPFQKLFDLDVKREFYERIDSVISGAKFVIIGSGINKEEHIKKYGKGAKDPYAISLAFVIERLVFCLDEKTQSIVEVKIEKRGRPEDQQLLGQYNTILDRGTYYVQSKRIKKIVSKFDFLAKKDNIIGLQIADLCAYPLARHILSPSVSYPSFEVIKEKLYCDEDGKFNGFGLKVFP